MLACTAVNHQFPYLPTLFAILQRRNSLQSRSYSHSTQVLAAPIVLQCRGARYGLRHFKVSGHLFETHGFNLTAGDFLVGGNAGGDRATFTVDVAEHGQVDLLYLVRAASRTGSVRVWFDGEVENAVFIEDELNVEEDRIALVTSLSLFYL